MKNTCIKNNCKKHTPKSLHDNIIVPFENDNDEVKRLFSYFLYRAPNIESKHSKIIDNSFHSFIMEEMMKDRDFKYTKFCSSNARIEEELRKGFMDENSICLKCKRFVCKRKLSRKNTPEETDFECFLRHIRNAIAHGRVYYFHASNRIHIVFEDENSSRKISARIICIKADLQHWKSVLSDERYYR